MAKATLAQSLFYVYAWYRSDSSPFYIGKGKGNRFKSLSTRSNLFLEILKEDSGANPKILYDQMTERDAFGAEMELIAEFGRHDQGGCLVNMTAGGEGGNGASAEMRAKISRKLTGRKNGPRSAELIAKVAAAQRAAYELNPRGPHTDEHKEKQSKGLKLAYAEGRRTGPPPMTGKTHSDATKKIMREKALGRIISEEQRRGISIRQTGKKDSDATKALKSKKANEAWADPELRLRQSIMMKEVRRRQRKAASPKPWVALEISERTYRRRKKAGDICQPR